MPDLQTALKTAIKTSRSEDKLVLKTLSQRMWEHIRDNPGRTNKQLVATFSHTNTKFTISRTSSDMLYRNMLVAEKVQPAGFGRVYFKYSVSPKLGGVFEVLPLPPKPKMPKEVPKPETLKAEVTPSTQVVGVVDTEPASVFLTSKEVIHTLDHLTLLEARKVYQYLHSIFGGLR